MTGDGFTAYFCVNGSVDLLAFGAYAAFVSLQIHQNDELPTKRIFERSAKRSLRLTSSSPVSHKAERRRRSCKKPDVFYLNQVHMSGTEANLSARNCETLSSSIQAELSRLPPFSKASFISKVPKLLRQVNDAAFAPLILSIGPLHCEDESFLPMEALKLSYLKSFLAASSANADLTAFLRAIICRESAIRDCYIDPIHLSTDDFTRMVLADGAFIIELLRKSLNPSLREDGDPIFQGSHTLAAVRRDLQLAENQLPSFILVDLYWMAFKPDLNNLPTFTDVSSEFLGLDKPRKPIISKEVDNNHGRRHLLDLSRYQYPYPSLIPLSTPSRGTIMCPTATRLSEAGVKFRAENPSRGFPAFNVRTRVLTIPKLRLTDGSEASLRNSIAFEQCDPHAEHHVTDYACFMDCIINTARDVELLVKAGVIENCMGDDEEAADLINSLCKHVDVSSFTLGMYYSRTCGELNRFYAKSWNRHKATLKQTYFSHPWAAISVVYAFVMLLSTLAQVVTGIISLR